MHGRDGICRPPAGARRRRRRGRPVLGRTRVTKTTEIGTAIRPRRSVTLPARADGSPSAPRRGVRPHVPFPPDPAPSAIRAFQPRTFAAAAQLPVARCAHWARRSDGSQGLTGGASHRPRREPHRWRRDHQRERRHAAATTGIRGAPGGADRRSPDVSGHAVESRRFTRDNWNYRAQTSVSRHVGTARVYHVVIRMWDHVRS